jgi:hypothetical protein
VSSFAEPPDLDLGDGHHLWWIRVDGVVVGAQYDHPSGTQRPTETGRCAGTFWLDTPEARAKTSGARPRWQVASMDPFTISPSLLCSCGDHGFIQGGKWVRC